MEAYIYHPWWHSSSPFSDKSYFSFRQPIKGVRSSSLSDEEVSAYLYVVIRYLILTIIITSPHLWTVA